MALNKNLLRVAGVGLPVAVLALGAWLMFAAGPPQPGDPGDPAQVARGKTIYAQQCASCHGTGLGGQPNWRKRKPDGRFPAPPHDESGHTWHHPDDQLFAVTKFGTAAFAGPGYRTDMKGFGDVLSDDEIWAVLAYIKSTWPEEIRRRQAAISGRHP